MYFKTGSFVLAVGLRSKLRGQRNSPIDMLVDKHYVEIDNLFPRSLQPFTIIVFVSTEILQSKI